MNEVLGFSGQQYPEISWDLLALRICVASDARLLANQVLAQYLES